MSVTSVKYILTVSIDHTFDDDTTDLVDFLVKTAQFIDDDFSMVNRVLVQREEESFE